jgi:predicted DNA-binding transcriptional regulator AlpA
MMAEAVTEGVLDEGERYICVKEVAQRFGVAIITIWVWTRQGQFPKPVKFGVRATRWRLSDLVKFEEQRRGGDGNG